jgi:hypothetical protein
MLVINQRNERYRYHVYVEPSVKYSTLYNSEKRSRFMKSSCDGK